MSRSSSGSGFFGRGAGVDVPALPAEFPLLGPLVGQECGLLGDAGVLWTVRTGSPACGRAEFVVPGRGSVGAGTGTVSSVGADEGTGGVEPCC